MDFFKRPGGSENGSHPSGGEGPDALLLEEYPTLAQYLGCQHWPDGKPRQLASLIVFWEEGRYKACLSDKDSACTLWATATTFEGIPEALEGRLTAEVVDWRKARPWKKKS